VWNTRAILPLITLANAGTSPTGSTKEVDELNDKHISVVIPTEYRYHKSKLSQQE